jgi:hypothetical protein
MRVKHLKKISMEIINIKVHPPWYARGTPIVNTRDGPPMALSDKPLFANGEWSSNKVKPGKCPNAYPDSTKLIGPDRPRKRAYRMRECINEYESRKPEDRSRGNSRGKTYLWLTLNITFFNTENRVYCRRYALLGEVDFDLSACAAPDNVMKIFDEMVDTERSWKADVDFDLSAYEVPDNVKMEEDNVKTETAVFFNAVKSLDVDRFEERSAVDFDLSAYAVPDFDLSAYEVPDNVKMEEDNVKMELDDKNVDADRSKDAVRSGEVVVDFYLSACQRWLSGLTTSN